MIKFNILKFIKNNINSLLRGGVLMKKPKESFIAVGGGGLVGGIDTGERGLIGGIYPDDGGIFHLIGTGSKGACKSQLK